MAKAVTPTKKIYGSLSKGEGKFPTSTGTSKKAYEKKGDKLKGKPERGGKTLK